MAGKSTGAKPQGLALAGHNYVGQDQIWKDHVDKEAESGRAWHDRWQFLAGDYRDFVKDEFPPTEKKVTLLPKHLQVNPGPALEECVSVSKSVRPVPRTTAGEVGWRSSEQAHNLEKYGRYCRGKGALIGQLKWPPEAIG
jgi:hypothetical protein